MPAELARNLPGWVQESGTSLVCQERESGEERRRRAGPRELAPDSLLRLAQKADQAI